MAAEDRRAFEVEDLLPDLEHSLQGSGKFIASCLVFEVLDLDFPQLVTVQNLTTIEENPNNNSSMENILWPSCLIWTCPDVTLCLKKFHLLVDI